MAKSVTIYGFETSNNRKVRVALGYKKIPYAFETIDPSDRSEIMRLSGQMLTPVMVHGDTVLFDSSAILRYLDANFPDTPRLFAGDYETIHEIEAWERFARGDLHEPLRMIVRMRRGGENDPGQRSRAAEFFAEATARLEEHLGGRDWLVGDEMTAADVSAAPVVRRVEGAGFFDLPEDRPRTRAWVDRVMAYDRGPEPAG